MSNIIPFRKHYQCDNCERHIIREDINDAPSYCSYGCGALSQPQYCVSVFSTIEEKE